MGLSGIVGACGFLWGSKGEIARIERPNLCVTEGAVRGVGDQILEVTAPAMRAVVLDSASSDAEVAFVYEGPSTEEMPLANGEVRRQIGLKLRAKDTCNVIYVMWRIEPQPGINVQVKANPGKSLHAECGATGYRNPAPARARPVRRAAVGDRHTLRSRLTEDFLEVFADDEIVWEGHLGRDVLDFDGPAGIRTDNARFHFEVRASVNPGLFGSGCTGG